MSTAALSHSTELPFPKHRASDSSLDGITEEKRVALTATIKQSRAIDLDELNKPKLRDRARTFKNAFTYLHHLTPKQVDEFMASYVIYNLDWADEPTMIAALGPNFRERVGECLRSYYGVLNHLCALGDVEKMYIPPVMDVKASVLENQILFEQAIVEAIGLSPGDRVLDLGCGRGRVAAHVANLSGAHVTGLNIDPDQITQARAFNTAKRGLADNHFVVHDFNILPLPFADASFDAFYQIQALSLCRDSRALFRELHRVLRPGSKLSILDWVRLPTYDSDNPVHAELMRHVKPLIGAVGTPSPSELETALEDAGFVLLKSENASINGLQAPLIDRVDTSFRALRQVLLVLVRLGLLPVHFKTLINRLCLGGQAFVKMDQMRLATTSYWIVAQKLESREVSDA